MTSDPIHLFVVVSELLLRHEADVQLVVLQENVVRCEAAALVETDTRSVFVRHEWKHKDTTHESHTSAKPAQLVLTSKQ